MEIKTDPDAGTVTLDISGTYTAQELRQVVEAIGQARAQIAQDPAQPQGTPVTLFTDVVWHTKLSGDSGPTTDLLFRTAWFGWIGFRLSPLDRTLLAGYFAHQQAGVMNAAAPAETAPGSRIAINQDEGGGSIH